MRILLISLFLSSAVMAYDFPLLQKTLGGLDKEDGVVKTTTCQVFDKHSGLKADEVIALVRKAEKEPIEKYVHIRREVPSVEVWANYPEKFAAGPATTGLRPHKVLLLQDSSTGKRRNGPAADELMKLLAVACKDK
ncbi:MAG: hypothetical protein KDD51_16580 [Bdellovibrionales bacterium]|nr:hypothetical protein [Bdellovibrionales bacterium]